jgi:hypothetical protein
MTNYTQSTNFATKDALTSGDPLKILKGTEINTEFANIAIAVATKADTASPTFTGTPVAPTASANNNSTQLATTAYIDAAITAVKTALFPVGAIYTAIVSTNPGTLLGFGTWTAFGAGRVPVGFDSTNALFDTAEETGGSADAITVSHSHTLSAAGSTAIGGKHAHGFGVNNGNNSGYFGLGTWTGYGYPGSDTVFWNGSGTSGGSGGNQTSGSMMTTGAITNTIGDGHTHTLSGSTDAQGTTGTNANYQPYITVYMWKRTA